MLNLLCSVFGLLSSMVSSRGKSTARAPQNLSQSVLHVGWRCVCTDGQTLQAGGGFLLFSEIAWELRRVWGYFKFRFSSLEVQVEWKEPQIVHESFCEKLKFLRDLRSYLLLVWAVKGTEVTVLGVLTSHLFLLPQNYSEGVWEVRCPAWVSIWPTWAAPTEASCKGLVVSAFAGIVREEEGEDSIPSPTRVPENPPQLSGGMQAWQRFEKQAQPHHGSEGCVTGVW